VNQFGRDWVKLALGLPGCKHRFNPQPLRASAEEIRRVRRIPMNAFFGSIASMPHERLHEPQDTPQRQRYPHCDSIQLQLGYEDTLSRPEPTLIEGSESVLSIFFNHA
jgi:hypothetical protein